MTNNSSGFSTILSTTQLQINDTTNNKSITIDNNASGQSRIDLFKNDGGGIYSTTGAVNTTTTQTLFLTHTDNVNDKQISIVNNRSGAGEISFSNLIDTSPLNITSNQSIGITAQGSCNVSSQANMDIGSSSANLNLNAVAGITNFTTTELNFTGASLQSNSSGGNSGEHLVIVLNGTTYKIKLENP
jgi:hypothetical protein